MVTPRHAYTLDPTKWDWADYAAVQARCGNISRNELTRNLSGNIWPQLSQLTEPLWTDPGTKSVISVRELISTLKKKRQAKNEWSNILPTSAQARIKPPPPPPPLSLLVLQKQLLWKFMSCTKLKDLQLAEPGKIGYTYKSMGSGFWALKQDDFRKAIQKIAMEVWCKEWGIWEDGVVE